MSVSKKQGRYFAVAIAVILTGLFIGSTMVSAHGVGSSFEEQVGETLVDIGYNVEDFTTDTSVVFDFSIKNDEGRELPFTDVWVRIVRDKSTVFATGIYNASLGGAIMTYTFPGTGEYELSARFQDDGKSIVEATFPLVVTSGASRLGENGSVIVSVLSFFGGAILSMMIFAFMRRQGIQKETV